jgi:hypothetical protein
VYVAIRLLTSVRDADADLVLAHLGGLSARLGKSIADSIGQQINAESDATEKVRFQRGGESALGQLRSSLTLPGHVSLTSTSGHGSSLPTPPASIIPTPHSDFKRADVVGWRG